MGNTNPHFMEGWRAFERGEPLVMGIDGWDANRSAFSDGWLAAASAAFGLES
jgi:hypothetical protein